MKSYNALVLRTFYSSYKHTQTRGVAILLSKKIMFHLSEQIIDTKGRYILVKGRIDHKLVILLNVYRPPGNDKTLMKNHIITAETSAILICGGDWNIQLQPFLDFINLTKRITPETCTVKRFLLQAGTMVIWREFHPAERQFTYFSHPHSVHSRIDYFFMFNSDRHRINVK